MTMAHIRIDDDFGKKALEEAKERARDEIAGAQRPRVPLNGDRVVLTFGASTIGGYMRAVTDREEWRFSPATEWSNEAVNVLKALVNRAPPTAVEVYGHRYLVWGMWGESFRLYDPARVPEAVAEEIALAASPSPPAPLPYTLTWRDGTPMEGFVGDGAVRDVLLNGHKVEVWTTPILPGVTYSARWVEGRITIGRSTLTEALRDLAARLPPTPEAGWVETSLTFAGRSTAVWVKPAAFVDLSLAAKDTSDPVWVELCEARAGRFRGLGPMPEVMIERKGEVTWWTVTGQKHLPVTGGGDHHTRLHLTPLSPAKQEPQGDPAPVRVEQGEVFVCSARHAENRRRWMLVGLNDGKWIKDPEERTAVLLEAYETGKHATDALANVVGAALMIATLGPGEAPKDAPDHALVHRVWELVADKHRAAEQIARYQATLQRIREGVPDRYVVRGERRALLKAVDRMVNEIDRLRAADPNASQIAAVEAEIPEDAWWEDYEQTRRGSVAAAVRRMAAAFEGESEYVNLYPALLRAWPRMHEAQRASICDLIGAGGRAPRPGKQALPMQPVGDPTGEPVVLWWMTDFDEVRYRLEGRLTRTGDATATFLPDHAGNRNVSILAAPVPDRVIEVSPSGERYRVTHMEFNDDHEGPAFHMLKVAGAAPDREAKDDYNQVNMGEVAAEFMKHTEEEARRAAFFPAVGALIERALKSTSSIGLGATALANAPPGMIPDEQRSALVAIALDYLRVNIVVRGATLATIQEGLQTLADLDLIPTAEGHPVIDPREALARVRFSAEITDKRLREADTAYDGYQWLPAIELARREAVASIFGVTPKDMWGGAAFTAEEAVLRRLAAMWGWADNGRKDGAHIALVDFAPTVRVVVETAHRAVAQRLALAHGVPFTIDSSGLPLPVEGKTIPLPPVAPEAAEEPAA
jgi:hypothetical protein